MNDEKLPEFLLEALTDETDTADMADIVALLSESVEPVKPPAELRKRLLASVGQGTERFAPLKRRFAELVDLTETKVDALLAKLDDATAWQPVPFPGVQLMHIDGGPLTAGADVGFVRIDAGCTFPEHTHIGQETVLILEGTYVDSDGTVVTRGDVAVRDAGTTHEITATDEGCVFAVTVNGGVEIDGQPYGVDDIA